MPGVLFERRYDSRSRLVHRGELAGCYVPVEEGAEHSPQLHSMFGRLSAAPTFVRDAILAATGVTAHLPPGPLTQRFGPQRL